MNRNNLLLLTITIVLCSYINTIDFNNLTPNQKQCVLLRRNLSSIPSDDIYSYAKETRITQFFNLISSSKLYNLKSFQSYSYGILKSIAELHVKENPEDSEISKEKFEEIQNIYGKMKNKKFIEEVPPPIDFNSTTEFEKVQFLIEKLKEMRKKLKLSFKFPKDDKLPGYIKKNEELINQSQEKLNALKAEKIGLQTAYDNELEKIKKKISPLTKEKDQIPTIRLVYEFFDKIDHLPEDTDPKFYEDLNTEFTGLLVKYKRFNSPSESFPKTFENYIIEEDTEKQWLTNRVIEDLKGVFKENEINQKLEDFKKEFTKPEEPSLPLLEILRKLSEDKKKISEKYNLEKLPIFEYNYHHTIYYKNCVSKINKMDRNDFKYEYCIKLFNETKKYRELEIELQKVNNNLIIAQTFFRIKIKLILHDNKPITDYFNTFDETFNPLKNAKIELNKNQDKIVEETKILKGLNLQLNSLNQDSEDSEFYIPNQVFLESRKNLSESENALKNFKTEIDYEQKLNNIENIEPGIKEKIKKVIKDQYELNPTQLRYLILEIEEDIKKIKIACSGCSEEYSIFLNYLKKVENYINLERFVNYLEIKNIINEILSEKLGSIFAKLQKMENNEKCFSLPTLSFHIFKILKTNMVFYQKTFLDSFLKNFDFEQKKKFILYNYMISNNKSYGIDQINKLKANSEESDQKKIIKKQEIFIENFTTNFSLFVNIIKDQTSFSNQIVREDTQILNFTTIGDLILSIVRIPVDYGLGDLEGNIKKETVDKIFFLINSLIYTSLPFLKFIPYFDRILKKLENQIYIYVKGMIIGLLSSAYSDYFNQIEPNSFTFNTKNDVIFQNPHEANYLDSIVNNEDFVRDTNEYNEVSINTNEVANIETKYNLLSIDENFDFNIFDAIDIFEFEDDFFNTPDTNRLLI